MHEFRARKCWCANNERQIYPTQEYYCMEPYTHCAIPAWWLNNDLTPGCVNRTRGERFARGVWPVVLVWFAAIFTCVCCTKPGRQVYDYILGMIIPGWNEWIVDRIQRRDPGRANRLIREHWRIRRLRAERRYVEHIAEHRAAPVTPEDFDEDETFAPIHELVLKTRIFKAEEEGDVGDDDSEFGDDNTCTICFVPIVDGDRVGELACDHVFHVECLKEWLKRRNICPLCQMPNAAAPRSRPPRIERQTSPVDDVNSIIDDTVEEQEAAPEPREAPALPLRNRLEFLAPTRNRQQGHRGTPGLTPFTF